MAEFKTHRRAFYSARECDSDHDYYDQFEPQGEEEPDIYDWEDDDYPVEHWETQR